ncbi:MAG: response regulator [Candidatus Kapabacteria bacterium]|nr:response regulator [Candidatus Kapabacteria bacterium]
MKMDHLLIIEDDPDVLENLKDILEYYGFYISTAIDGLEGYDKAVELMPDLIICDVNLPEIDGFELLDMLKRTPETYMIPFLFLTAYTDKSLLRKGMNLGADDYITKPYDNKDLLNAVKSKIEKYDDLRNGFARNLEYMKGRITNSIPNHFAAPIHSILGFATVLKNNYFDFDDSDRISIIENIYESGDLMLKMLDNYGLYLKLSSKSYNEFDFIEDDFPADKIIKYAIEKEGSVYGITSKVRTTLEPALLKMGSGHIKKIVLEFISIATRFGIPEKEIYFHGKINENNNYELSVSFFSKGFSDILIKSISDLESIGLKDIDSKYCSLSLSLIKLLVELHKGKMFIESIPYDKTTITVLIPLKD